MSLIEGIGDEVTQFFITLIVILVVSLAWWTTSISEQNTAWILDRRRHRTARRLTNHTHSVTIAEVHFVVDADSATDTGVAVAEVQQPPAEPPKPPEDTPSTSSADSTTNQEEQQIGEEQEEEEEQSSIVAAMDADNCVLRQRRLAFYNRNAAEAPAEQNEDDLITSSAESVRMEHNYAEAPAQSANDNHSDDEIRIKLKFINDDIRVVEGNLQEQLGDFKKRHFQSELAANKIIRLIFNGHVLGQDSSTLQGCGFFNNCVVHCLIHQRRAPPAGEDGGAIGSGDLPSGYNNNMRSAMQNNNNNNNNNNQGRDWDLGNILFAIISFVLLSAWYFRYVYAHLYTVTATVGLILMTGIFTILLFGFYFPDDVPTRMDNVSPPPSPIITATVHTTRQS